MSDGPSKYPHIPVRIVEDGEEVWSLSLKLHEVHHLKNLLGKDIGWHKKYGTGKDVIAAAIYAKLNRLVTDSYTGRG